MKVDLDKGIGPNEALKILLTEDDKKKYGIRNRLTVARFLKKQLAAGKLPCVVRCLRPNEGDYILVARKAFAGEDRPNGQ